MTYSTTQAQSGRGTSLGIGSTPVTIGEIRSITQSGNQWETSDVTNMQSGIAKEFIVTIVDGGEYDITCNRVSTDPGQAALEAAFEGTTPGTLQPFTLTYLKSPAQTTTGDSVAFKALVQSKNISIEPTKEVTISWKLKVSGLPVPTAGS